MASRQGLKFDIRTGALIEDDDDVLRDGQRIVVPLNMRDSMSPMQRAVAEDKAARGVTVVDGLGRTAGHRPGACYLRTVPHTVDHAVAVTQEHLRSEAYADSIRELCDAWKGNTNDREVARVHDTGDPVADAWLDQKYDLENSWHHGSGKRSQDSAPAGPVYDAVEGQRVKDEAYRAMVNEMTTAWQRKP